MILNRARDLFLEKGYHKTSVRTIVNELGLSTGAFYFYFRNKAEVFVAICCEGLDTLIGAYRKAAAKEDHAAFRLREIFYAFRDFYRREQKYYRIIEQLFNPLAGIDIPPDLRPVIEKKTAGILEIMEGIIKEGISRGEIREVRPRSLALYLMAVTKGLFLFGETGFLEAHGSGIDDIIEEAVLLIGFGMVSLPVPPELYGRLEKPKNQG